MYPPSSADFICNLDTSSASRLVREGRLSERQKTVSSSSSYWLKNDLVSCKCAIVLIMCHKNCLWLGYFFWCRLCHYVYCMSCWSIQLPDQQGLGWIAFWSSSLRCFHQETMHELLSSWGVSCLQGKLASIVHSLCGHILWAMAEFRDS